MRQAITIGTTRDGETRMLCGLRPYPEAWEAALAHRKDEGLAEVLLCEPSKRFRIPAVTPAPAAPIAPAPAQAAAPIEPAEAPKKAKAGKK